MQTTKKKLKVQMIVEGEGKWPYVGNAYENKDGSFSILLDPGVTLHGGAKLFMRAAFHQGGAKPETRAESPAQPKPATRPPARGSHNEDDLVY